MEPVITQVTKVFRRAVTAAFGTEIDPLVTASQDQKFGDYQANVAMSLAGRLAKETGQKTNPRAVAEQIKSKLDFGDIASEISIAGPGFINVRLNPSWVAKQIAEIVVAKNLGIEPTTKPVRTVIDYSSPNVAKEMHVGHLRSTILGDALARVLTFLGHPVVRQNHLGDWGTQFGMLLQYLEESGGAATSQISDLEEFYRSAKKRFDEDPAFADRSRLAVVNLQKGDPKTLELWKKIVNESRKAFAENYKRLGVILSEKDECGESFYNPRLAGIVQMLVEKGIAVESEGAIVVEVKGFDAPLIIRKKDGGYMYGTTDLAALAYRTAELKGQRLIYVVDIRQEQHFRQFFDAGRRAGIVGDTELVHLKFGTICGADGKPLKTREGGTIKLRDLLNEAEERALKMVRAKMQERDTEISEDKLREIAKAIGIGAVKYFDMNRDPQTNYTFDWDTMLSMDGNTAPYLQYAHARVKTMLKKVAYETPKVQPAIVLHEPQELELAKHLLIFGEVLEVVSKELKPNYLCTHLYGVATKFSAFYQNCPVLTASEELKQSRMLLSDLTGRTLALGLELLGIEHPDSI